MRDKLRFLILVFVLESGQLFSNFSSELIFEKFRYKIEEIKTKAAII